MRFGRLRKLHETCAHPGRWRLKRRADLKFLFLAIVRFECSSTRRVDQRRRLQPVGLPELRHT